MGRIMAAAHTYEASAALAGILRLLWPCRALSHWLSGLGVRTLSVTQWVLAIPGRNTRVGKGLFYPCMWSRLMWGLPRQQVCVIPELRSGWCITFSLQSLWDSLVSQGKGTGGATQMVFSQSWDCWSIYSTAQTQTRLILDRHNKKNSSVEKSIM